MRILGFALALATGAAAAHADPVELQWWHAMTAVNGERINKIAADFNAAQADYKVTPVFKGSYAEAMTAAIAAYRAGNAPDIVQVFEVGTATMMAAKGAIKPVYQLMDEAKEPFDPSVYLPAVTGYYSTPEGKMLSFPFNSSTPVLYLNKDAFQKAGLDPGKPPKTWPEVFDDAKKLRAAGVPCGFTSSWVSWVQIENFSARHNLPIGTKANGLGGFDTELVFNNPTVTRHIANLAEAQKDKSFDYGGRETQADSKFVAGDCGMTFNSSGYYGLVKAGAKFQWGVTQLPYYPDVAGAPQNSIIGGASLWVMGGKKPEQYKGIAKFFTYLSGTPVQEWWHEQTGYLPITRAAYDATKASGFYEKNPGTEIAILQMTGKPPTENSRGLRFGNMVQIRDVIAEDLEAAFSGKTEAKAALDDAVSRGNALLRQFQKNIQ
ncbi:MAG: sn-glycerol-3-phosphate ABC transporter substrate-binding protein UgpB [Alphaproteobacteria bacterium]|nr:sn-glycerol-3-phosphate ABC transporter substrate-binding protein UgpB [Alphaproteobacteria bacterium]